jgi:hypothetical protein
MPKSRKDQREEREVAGPICCGRSNAPPLSHGVTSLASRGSRATLDSKGITTQFMAAHGSTTKANNQALPSANATPP